MMKSKRNKFLSIILATTLILGLAGSPIGAIAAETSNGTEAEAENESETLEVGQADVDVSVGEEVEDEETTTANDTNVSVASTEDSSDSDTEIASGTCGDDLTWVLTEDGTLTISGTGEMYDWGQATAPWYDCRDSVTDIVIGDGVTSIGNCAFSCYENVTTVTIGEGITSIGIYAFEYCNNLVNLVIPDNVSIIDDYAFYSCANLENVILGNSVVSIGDYAFMYCSNLSKINFPNNLTAIGTDTFYNCSSLTSITLPDNLLSIDSGAFYGCSQLINIIIPEKVTEIAENTFHACSALTTITIPVSVTAIGNRAFNACENLTDVYYTGSESDWDNITFGIYNECLTDATIHYNSTMLDAVSFAGGDGTEENPYQVATAEQLDAVRNHLSAYYIQTSDIDLEGYEWISIGDYDNKFTGSYNGNSYQINNLSIVRNSITQSDSYSYCGLFAYNTGSIQDVTLENCLVSLDTTDFTPTTSNYIGTIAAFSEGQINNCSVSGDIGLNDTVGITNLYFGGIIGYGSCDSCINSANVTFECNMNCSQTVYCGGISGYTSTVSKSVNYGDISVIGSTFLRVGGIAGSGSVDTCVNYGNVYAKLVGMTSYGGDGENCCVGGILGLIRSKATDCVNFGDIGTDVDVSHYIVAGCSGGIVGSLSTNYSGIIENCYNIADTINTDMLQETYNYYGTGRIQASNGGGGGTVQISECYSLDSTLVNGEIPDESIIGPTTMHGGNMTEGEIVNAIAYILEELGIEYSTDIEDTEGSDYFILSDDGNSFLHAAYTFYSISDDKAYSTCYAQKLLNSCNPGFDQFYMASVLCSSLDREHWAGACQGLSTTIALANIGLFDLCFSGEYSTLQAPKENITLRDEIIYYHLLQYLSGYEPDEKVYTDGIFKNTDMSAFLKNLTEEAIKSQNEQVPFLFIYTHGSYTYNDYNGEEQTGGSGGHCVVVCGFHEGKYIVNGTEYKYSLVIYDPNCLNKYQYIYITDGYTGFYLEDGNYVPLQDVWDSMSFIGVDSIQSNFYQSPSSYTGRRIASTSDVDTSYSKLVITAEEDYVLTNAEGETFIHNSNEYYGTMNIESSKTIVNDTAGGNSSCVLSLTTDASESYTLTNFEDGFVISVEIDGQYYSAIASGADTIVLSKDDGIVIEGESEYTFSAAINVDLDSCEMIRITGTTSGTTQLVSGKDGSTLTTENECKNITVETYQGVDYSSQQLDEVAMGIIVSDNADDSIKIDVIVPEVEHVYGEPKFAWADDYTSCTASFTCNDCGETETVDCTVNSTTTDATCTENGETVYTASCTFNGEEYSDVQSASIPSTGHSFENGVCVNCGEKKCTDISKCTITLSQTSYTYDGSEHKPYVTVTDPCNDTLESNDDYTFLYNNNISAGTATVTVTGVGEYTGSATASFTIKKANQIVKAATANSSLTGVGSTTIITVTTTGDGAITYKSSDTAVVTADKKGLVTAVNAGTATITVTAAETKNYKSGSTTLDITVLLATPSLSGISNTKSGVKITWDKVSGATKYRVYRKSGSGSWKKLADVASNSYTDKTVQSGTSYKYTVRCISPDGSSNTSAYDTTGLSIKNLKAGKISSLKNTSKGITVKWSKVSGAKGYYVYRKTSGGSFKKIATITSGSTVSYSDTFVKSKNGKTYIYAVRPYYGSTKGSYTSKTIVRLSSPSISSLKNSASKKMTVKWGKNSKATGYQIQYSTSSSFSSYKTVTVKSYKTVSKTISKLKKGKKYYVRVRAYKTVSGTKYYSAWSSKKSVKISK